MSYLVKHWFVFMAAAGVVCLAVGTYFWGSAIEAASPAATPTHARTATPTPTVQPTPTVTPAPSVTSAPVTPSAAPTPTAFDQCVAARSIPRTPTYGQSQATWDAWTEDQRAQWVHDFIAGARLICAAQ